MTLDGQARKWREAPRMPTWPIVLTVLCLSMSADTQIDARLLIPPDEEAMPLGIRQATGRNRQDEAQESPRATEEQRKPRTPGRGAMDSCSESLSLTQAGKVRTRRQPSPSDHDINNGVHRSQLLLTAGGDRASQISVHEYEFVERIKIERSNNLQPEHQLHIEKAGDIELKRQLFTATLAASPTGAPEAAKAASGTWFFQRILAWALGLDQTGISGFVIGLSVLGALLGCLTVMGIAIFLRRFDLRESPSEIIAFLMYGRDSQLLDEDALDTEARWGTGARESTSPKVPAPFPFCTDLIVPQPFECVLLVPIRPSDANSVNIMDTSGNVLLQVQSRDGGRFELTTGYGDLLAQWCGPASTSAASNAIEFHLFRANGDYFACLTPTEDQFQLRTVTGQSLHFFGSFEGHEINITDDSMERLAFTYVRRAEFDADGQYYEIIIRPLVDVGLLLCSLFCIHRLTQASAKHELEQAASSSI